MFKQSTAFKGLAVFLVVVNHTIVMGSAGLGKINIQLSDQFQIGLSILAALGLYAVPLFLFYGGGFTQYALENRDLRTSYKIIFTTILIVLWPYIIWSCVFYLLIYLDGGTTFSFWGYLKNLLVGYPFNFVPILIFFYLISPFLQKIKGPFIAALLFFFLLYQIFLILLNDPDFTGLLPESLHIFAIPVVREPLRTWALYFPMGFYVKHLLSLISVTKQYFRTVLIVLTLLILGVNLVSILGHIGSPWIKYLLPIPFVLLSIYWQREKIPFYKFFERLGKRSYGIYLINLIFLDVLVLLLIPVLKTVPGFALIYFIILFMVTVSLPVFMMERFEKLVSKKIYRFIFG